jgi:VWFA-related protein
MQTNRLALAVFVVALMLLMPASVLSQSTDSVDTIRVDSDLVDLKVSVVSLNVLANPTILTQKDFKVLEDGTEQEIAFFAAADTPFDLILLLDLSGSTSKKINLIRRSAKRFVDATRPMDRVGIITFTYEPQVVAELTEDRELLKRSIDDIEKPLGGTNFWDATQFVLNRLKRAQQPDRRSAVVVMTDGVDNALPDIGGDGSQISFEELLTNISNSDVLVFPVYLDTEKEMLKSKRGTMPAYAIAREQLDRIAQACGTITYRAGELKDLEKVYERVIKDLSTVYSIGYRPSNTRRDGKWRSVSVVLNERPDLAVRTKGGYFAKMEVQSLKNDP